MGLEFEVVVSHSVGAQHARGRQFKDSQGHTEKSCLEKLQKKKKEKERWLSSWLQTHARQSLSFSYISDSQILAIGR